MTKSKLKKGGNSSWKENARFFSRKSPKSPSFGHEWCKKKQERKKRKANTRNTTTFPAICASKTVPIRTKKRTEASRTKIEVAEKGEGPPPQDQRAKPFSGMNKKRRK